MHHSVLIGVIDVDVKQVDEGMSKVVPRIEMCSQGKHVDVATSKMIHGVQMGVVDVDVKQADGV